MRAPSLGREDPRRKAWQPTPVFLPGESHGQESGELQSIGSQTVGNDFATKQQQHNLNIYVTIKIANNERFL